jgi:hypothetical protein
MGYQVQTCHGDTGVRMASQHLMTAATEVVVQPDADPASIACNCLQQLWPAAAVVATDSRAGLVQGALLTRQAELEIH